ncbi:hypothetical protein AB0D78_46745 [Streptomyces avermitilis]|uniref:hypothetical protein n=1 Tax=Streptomyces avermitilis TaxID=33903 RepID=UPI0033C7419C
MRRGHEARTRRPRRPAAHRPDGTGLTAVLPTPDGPATVPVERGDLPPVRDGAPDNDVGTTG